MKEVLIIDETKNANMLAQVVGESFGCLPKIANSMESAEKYFNRKFDVAIIGEMDGKYREIYSRVNADKKIVYTKKDSLIEKCKLKGIEAHKNTGHEEMDLVGVIGL
jgi:hypothetical protein